MEVSIIAFCLASDKIRKITVWIGLLETHLQSGLPGVASSLVSKMYIDKPGSTVTRQERCIGPLFHFIQPNSA